jgi:hypothetical protein
VRYLEVDVEAFLTAVFVRCQARVQGILDFGKEALASCGPFSALLVAVSVLLESSLLILWCEVVAEFQIVC